MTGALEDAHHARVADEHVGPEAANAASLRVFQHTRAGDVAGNLLGRLTDRIVEVFHDRSLDRDETSDAAG